MEAFFMGTPRYMRDTRILIRAWGAPEYDSLAVATISVEMPSQVEWVSGDTLRRVDISPSTLRPPSGRRWVVTVRPRQTGRCELRWNFRAEPVPGQGHDETDCVIALEIRTDSVKVLERPHPTRFERIRDGRRFRFADGYLVPIEASEALLEGEIAVKPRVLFPSVGSSPRRAAPRTPGIPFVAMIGADGCLLGADPLEEPGATRYESSLVERARHALDGWQFAPAQAKGHAVADYLVVHVAVSDP